MRSRAVASLVACVVFVCISHGTARSAELKIFASRAIWTVLAEIGPEFEKNSGHKLDVITGLSSEFVGRINAEFPGIQMLNTSSATTPIPITNTTSATES